MVIRSSASAAVHYLKPAATAASASTPTLRSAVTPSSCASSRSSYASSSSTSAAVSQLEAGVLHIVQGMARREMVVDSSASSPSSSSSRVPAPSRTTGTADTSSANQQARALLKRGTGVGHSQRGSVPNASSQCPECRLAAQHNGRSGDESEQVPGSIRHEIDPPRPQPGPSSVPLDSRTRAKNQKQLYAEIVETLARDPSVPVEDVFRYFRLDPYGRDLVLPSVPLPGPPEEASPPADLSQLLNPPTSGSNLSKREWLTSVIDVKTNRTAYGFAIRGLAHRNEFEAADLLFLAFLRRCRQRRQAQQKAKGNLTPNDDGSSGKPQQSGASDTFDLDAFMLTFRWTAETMRVKSFTRAGKGTSLTSQAARSSHSSFSRDVRHQIGDGTFLEDPQHSGGSTYQNPNERSGPSRVGKRERNWPQRTRDEALYALAEVLSFIDVRASDFDRLPKGVSTRAPAFPGCALPYDVAPILSLLPSDDAGFSRTAVVEPSPQLMTNVVYSLSKHWGTHRAAIATWIAMERRWPLVARDNGNLNALVLSARSLTEAVTLRHREKMRLRREGKPFWHLTHPTRSKARKDVAEAAAGNNSIKQSTVISGTPQRPSPSTSIWSYTSLAHDLRAIMLARSHFRAWLFLTHPDLAPAGICGQSIPDWLPSGHRKIGNRIMMGSDQILDLYGGQHARVGSQLLAQERGSEELDSSSEHPEYAPYRSSRGGLTFTAEVFHAYAQLVAAMVEMRYLPTPYPRQTPKPPSSKRPDTENEQIESAATWPPPRYAFSLPRPWPSVDELVRILVWMRELKVQPWDQTLCLIADSLQRYYHRHQLTWPKKSSNRQLHEDVSDDLFGGLRPSEFLKRPDDEQSLRKSNKNRFEGMGPLSEWMSGWEGLEKPGLTTLEVRNYAKYLRTAIKVPMRPIWERP